MEGDRNVSQKFWILGALLSLRLRADAVEQL